MTTLENMVSARAITVGIIGGNDGDTHDSSAQCEALLIQSKFQFYCPLAFPSGSHT